MGWQTQASFYITVRKPQTRGGLQCQRNEIQCPDRHQQLYWHELAAHFPSPREPFGIGAHPHPRREECDWLRPPGDGRQTTHARVDVGICVCACARVCVKTHTYIHTYIHTYKQEKSLPVTTNLDGKGKLVCDPLRCRVHGIPHHQCTTQHAQL